MTQTALAKTIALVRIATSVFFLLFGEYKLAGPAFAHGSFQAYLQSYISNDSVTFYRPVLARLIQPHAVFFGYFVGVLEMFVGLCLLLGLWVRVASLIGILFLLNLTLASWWDVGHGQPLWRYFGARLDTLPLLLLLVLLFASNAGRVWGMDALRDGMRRF
jgi:uncharacterized membrane protein YphA (DoxX/SURF4 family)